MHRAKPFACIVALFALTSLPYVYGAWSTPADRVYTGLMFDVPDHAQYWSWVTASRNALFISNTMTPEPNPAVFMNPMMWLLSQLQQTLNLSFAALFQWWRVIAILLFVPALSGFVRVFVPERDRRWFAMSVAIFGSGLGWMWVVGKKLTGGADVPFPHDLYTVEPNTFWTMLSYPYILQADALVLATMLGAWLAYRHERKAGLVLGAAAALCLSLSHAYDLITVYAVLGLYGLFEWIRTRRFPLRFAIAGAVIAAASAPAAFYYQRLTQGDPLWRSILSQYSNAGVWTPPGYHLVVLLGFPLLLAAWSIASRDNWQSDERRFLSVWALTSLGLVYLPVVYQIKLLTAWQFPIAILAVHAWHERIAIRPNRLVPARALAIATVVLVSSTNMYLFMWRFIELRRHEAPYYLHRDEADALSWLAANTRPTDVVIAPADLGQFVPNYGASRAYLAHWAMTNRFFERRRQVEKFFDSEATNEWRRDLLHAEGVTLVLRRGEAPSSDKAFDPSSTAGYQKLFSRPRAQVYRFSMDAPPSLARGIVN